MHEFTFHTDPGHGWLCVPLDLVERLEFRPTRYSYHHREFAYLEEDCDAPAFLAALTTAGETYRAEREHVYPADAPIRGMTRFPGTDPTHRARRAGGAR